MRQRHTNLIAWQRADDLFIEVHRLTKRFPADERFELCSPANIVEGIAATYEGIDTHARQVAAPLVGLIRAAQ